MTSSEAKGKIGRMVVERDVVGEAGVLREVHRTYWQDTEQQRAIWMAKVQYRGSERWVPLTAVRLATKADSEQAVPRVRPGVPHQGFMAGVRSLLGSGPPTLESSPAVFYGVESNASGLFRLAFGRLPTAAELDFMVGVSPDRCGRCDKSRRRAFLPDGTFGDECECTDQMDAGFKELCEGGGR